MNSRNKNEIKYGNCIGLENKIMFLKPGAVVKATYTIELLLL